MHTRVYNVSIGTIIPDIQKAGTAYMYTRHTNTHLQFSLGDCQLKSKIIPSSSSFPRDFSHHFQMMINTQGLCSVHTNIMCILADLYIEQAIVSTIIMPER